MHTVIYILFNSSKDTRNW